MIRIFGYLVLLVFFVLVVNFSGVKNMSGCYLTGVFYMQTETKQIHFDIATVVYCT